MSNEKEYSNAAISALYGAEPSAKPAAAIPVRAPKAKSHNLLHNRNNGFEKKSAFNMYGMIFAACATITALLYLVSK